MATSAARPVNHQSLARLALQLDVFMPALSSFSPFYHPVAGFSICSIKNVPQVSVIQPIEKAEPAGRSPDE